MCQLPLDLHQRVCEAREQSGLTTAQYITNLLIEYYEMKENGGNEIMANEKTRTMAFRISEELFQRIKAHLERESARLGGIGSQGVFSLAYQEIHGIMDGENDPGGPRYASNTQSTITYRHLRR